MPLGVTVPDGLPRRARGALVLALAAVAVLAPVGLAAARWPSWWAWIASEQTPMTWLQSVVLVLAAAGSLLVAYVLALLPRTRGPQTRDTQTRGTPARDTQGPWLLLAAGFTGLAVDERFALHERVRDSFLAPRGVSLPLLTWIGPGDFLVLLVAVAGLAVLPIVLRAVAADRAAWWALVVGVALAAGAVAMDSVDPATWSTAGERLQQTLEEVVELGAGLCFLACVGLRLLAVLAGLAAGEGIGEDTTS